MESKDDLASVQENLQNALVSTVRTVNRISAEDLGFQRTIDPDVGEKLDSTTSRILELANLLLRSSGKACGVNAPKLEDVEDIDMNWRSVVDVVDSVLEKADTALDEYTGLIKRKEPTSAESAPNAKRPKSTNKVIRNANIAKPQVQFERKPENFPTGPWKPLLSSKPHAQVPLDKSLVTFTNENGTAQFKHPYEAEITSMEYPANVFEVADPVPYQPMEGTKATYVDTFEGVLEMLEHLRKAKEIAVDLEHHDFRTYIGLVSLMQISTRDQDWIVDTLKPWRHKLEVLNEVFADPSIVKVFHGAYMDMVWLQRDLGLYVNALFDTYFACEYLAYQARSLAFLLSKFINFDADKQYQLADWRMRPLPEEMLYYARSDTHFLLYIYDCVRNELVNSSDPSSPETNLIAKVLQRSKELALSRYEHPTLDEATGEGSRGWYNYILKHGHLAYNAEQFAVFRALWKWRDDVARTEDENPNFVLGTTTISDIARINPPDPKALHSSLPLSAPLVKPRLAELWQRIQETKAEGGPSLLQFLTSLSPDALKKGNVARLAAPQNSLPKLDSEIVMVRLAKSRLFGDMPISSRWEYSKQTPSNGEDNIPFPWQRFLQEHSEQGLDEDQVMAATDEAGLAGTDEPVDVTAKAEATEEPDDEFTLKKGRKKKPAATDEEEDEEEEEEEEGEQKRGEDEDEENEDEGDSDAEVEQGEAGLLSLDDGESKSKKDKAARRAAKRAERKARNAEAEQARQAKKAERKALKAQRKQEKEQKKQGDQKSYNAVPFDYSTAASVMNASREAKSSNGKKPVFDPYAKTADDGLKGARKALPIKGERSGTFKK
ncbi:unnamed protein product [Clonostachys byssicola]|uniref:HRDC domain-containing protein n=1 Tax=Clonostachys byssicola TaxID=160290 RepID=A0A9N9UMN9_9HYPO|nr:unnamed protein product [Clonostachys byssicola]